MHHNSLTVNRKNPEFSFYLIFRWIPVGSLRHLKMPICTDHHGIDAAVRCLLENFPESMWGRWLDIHQVHSQLQRGGFPNLPSDVVSRSFRGTHVTVRSDKYRSTRYYLFGDAKSLERAPKSYRDQVLLKQNNNKECRLSPNYYIHQQRLQGPLKDRIALLIEAGYAARDQIAQPASPRLKIKIMLLQINHRHQFWWYIPNWQIRNWKVVQQYNIIDLLIIVVVKVEGRIVSEFNHTATLN